MNAPFQMTRDPRLTPSSGLKLTTCAALSLIITLLTASVIGQAMGPVTLAPGASVSAAALTLADAR